MSPTHKVMILKTFTFSETEMLKCVCFLNKNSTTELLGFPIELVCCGCWGLPYLEQIMGVLLSWCFALFVSWFLGYKVSWFQSLLVSWFQNSEVSKFQSSNVSKLHYVLLEYIGPELPKFHFMFFELYWSHLQDYFRRVVGMFRRPSFQNRSKVSMFKMLIFPKLIFFKMIREFPRILWGILVSQKVNDIGCGAQGHVQKFRNHEIEGFSNSPMTKSQSY